jgi:uncharacterized protein
MNTAIIFEYLLEELGIDEGALKNTLSLLGKGSTIPFIARYRKEQTGSLDETKIRSISEKFTYYAELEARKDTIVKSISEQGKLTDDLKAKILKCRQKFALEDLYLPYKPKQRTKATIAKEKGLEPLADLILKEQPSEGDRDKLISGYVDPSKGVATLEAALEEALEIVIENISENADVRAALRDLYKKTGVLVSKVRHELDGTKTKFEAYYNFSELLSRSPSHRVLAIRRGSKEKVLSWSVEVPEEEAISSMILKTAKNPKSLFHKDLLKAIATTFRRSLSTSLEVEMFKERIDISELEAINVFAKNLRNLLLAAPAGHKTIMGIDPGIKTGCKVAVVDRSGNFKEFKPVYLQMSDRLKEEAEKAVVDMIKKHGVELVSVGNGTASKEAFSFMDGIVKKHGLSAKVVMTSEAGASVYSASDSAREEFPDLDITVKGAISIARRIQDPLAELVKIDPKSIGVGQYQHDVNQTELKKSLDMTVESCVNFVGVELNTASKELLTYVSGIGPFIAKNVINYRREKGPFKAKKDLLKVPGVGDKVFEQAAGFLKIRDSEDPLDNSAIHPESFHIVEEMARDAHIGIKELIGNEKAISGIDINSYVTGEVGIPTLEDMIRELKKPGLDPREEFTSVEFSAAINEIDDLSMGMVMDGVVTNVTDFGAFVDIGVHQDGLMHVSKMSQRFIKNPYEVISVGDKIKVKVISIDKALKRIGLEMYKK